MRIVVTGADGFVGRSVCRVLADAGHDVVALTRRTSSNDARLRQVRWAGVHDLGAIDRAFEAAEAAVHLASRVHVMHDTASDPDKAFHEVNVAGTINICRAASRANVGRVVFVSTIKVNGDGRETPYRPTDPPAPVGAYARSKAAAEEVVRAELPAGGWTILRPCLVFGPGVRGNFERLLGLAARSGKYPVPLGGLRNRRSLSYVENLAHLLSLALVHSVARGKTYLVAEEPSLSTTALLEMLARSLGVRPRLVRVPTALVRAVARLAGMMPVVDRVFGSLEADVSLQRRELGWSAPVSLQEGLAATARWWLMNGRSA